MRKLYLYGASGHAKIIIDILVQQEEIGFWLIDDNPEINDLILIWEEY